jgi:hypothetical protein
MDRRIAENVGNGTPRNSPGHPRAGRMMAQLALAI